MTFLLYGYSVELLLSGACCGLHHLETPEWIIMLYQKISFWNGINSLYFHSFYLLSMQNKTKTWYDLQPIKK